MHITIPIDKEKLLVKAGQHVDFSTPLYQTSVSSVLEVAVAQKLEVQPQHIFRHMVRYVGDSIEKNDTLALKKGFFGNRTVRSPGKGVVQEIDHAKGIVRLTLIQQEEEVKTAFFTGIIEKIEQASIRLKVHASKSFETKVMQGVSGGRLVFATKENEESMDFVGSFVVCESLKPYDIAKYDALGAVGFISLHTPKEKMSLPYAVIKKIEDWKTLVSDQFPYCVFDPLRSTIVAYQA